MVLTVMVIVGVGHMDCNTRPICRGMNEKYSFCLNTQKVILVLFEIRMRIEETVICV